MTNIDKIFTYHKPNDEQINRYNVIRIMAKDLAFIIEDFCNDSEEKKQVLLKLRETVMWANAAIAIHEN